MPIPTATNPSIYLHYDRPPSVTVGPAVNNRSAIVKVGTEVGTFFEPADATSAELFALCNSLADACDYVRDLALDAEKREKEATAA